ncbi:MAG: hypothetical protein R3E75_13010 [Steroidobacteraceae bacterium]|nr:hypothetical protein [Nevskiaceae bacterium]
MTHLLCNLSQDMRRDILPCAFRINNQQNNRTARQSRGVDDPHSTAFSGTGTRPSYLPAAARPWNDVTNLGVARDECRKLSTLFL